jgi:hypothetical protein
LLTATAKTFYHVNPCNPWPMSLPLAVAVRRCRYIRAIRALERSGSPDLASGWLKPLSFAVAVTSVLSVLSVVKAVVVRRCRSPLSFAVAVTSVLSVLSVVKAVVVRRCRSPLPFAVTQKSCRVSVFIRVHPWQNKSKIAEVSGGLSRFVAADDFVQSFG